MQCGDAPLTQHVPRAANPGASNRLKTSRDYFTPGRGAARQGTSARSPGTVALPTAISVDVGGVALTQYARCIINGYNVRMANNTATVWEISSPNALERFVVDSLYSKSTTNRTSGVWTLRRIR